MEAATAQVRSNPSARVVSCVWCRASAPYSEIVRNRGLCGACVRENAEIGWRVVYDRDNKVGAIPRNLRDAYRL